jgi:hypothetical protein
MSFSTCGRLKGLVYNDTFAGVIYAVSTAKLEELAAYFGERRFALRRGGVVR